MKIIPKNELIIMLQEGLQDIKLISQTMMENIFERYGDDYFKPDMNWYADWELSNENEERKRLMRS